VNSKTEKRLLGETSLKLKEIEGTKDHAEKLRLRTTASISGIYGIVALGLL
jgi:hypothetical protein